jgi:hypothetical protein
LPFRIADIKEFGGRKMTEIKPMTVGDIKEKLKDLPDDLCVFHHSSDSLELKCLWDIRKICVLEMHGYSLNINFYDFIKKTDGVVIFHIED